MAFPQSISLTITNHCNLRCQMCGQWSDEGYMQARKDALRQEMTLLDWKRVVDELAAHHIPSLLLRGGEPFLFPDIVELLEYIHSQGIFIAIDTNGTMLKSFAADIIRISGIHLTISVDGPEAIHDEVRGVKGSFQRIKEGLAVLGDLEQKSEQRISRSINFTISPYSVRGLGVMPAVARDLSIGSISIVPYYYVPEFTGRQYERELRDDLDCPAFSWTGFHHEESGVDFWHVSGAVPPVFANPGRGLQLPLYGALRRRIPDLVPGSLHAGRAFALHERREINRYPAQRRCQLLRGFPGLCLRQCKRDEH